MVAASKYAKAERELKAAKSFGSGVLEFYEKTGLRPTGGSSEVAGSTPDTLSADGKSLMIIMSSDKGLCGSIHASLARHVRTLLREGKLQSTEYVILGDKVRTMLQRQLNKSFTFTGQSIGRKSLSFKECSTIAQSVNEIISDYGNADILYNKFRSVIAYKVTTVPVMSAFQIEKSQALANYEWADSETIRCYQEFHLASLLYYTFKENFTCELASRMNAMEGATKNAGELIDKLRLYYNRTRQSVITRELIEIISGASVLEQQRQGS